VQRSLNTLGIWQSNQGTGCPDKNEFKQAENFWNSIDPKSDTARTALGNLVSALVQERNYQEAIKVSQSVVTDNQDYGPAHALLGDVLRSYLAASDSTAQSGTDECDRQFNVPAIADVIERMGYEVPMQLDTQRQKVLEIAMHEYCMAIELSQQNIEKLPNDARSYHRIGAALFGLRRSLGIGAKVGIPNPGNCSPILYVMQRPEKLLDGEINSFRKAIEIAPDVLEYHHELVLSLADWFNSDIPTRRHIYERAKEADRELHELRRLGEANNEYRGCLFARAINLLKNLGFPIPFSYDRPKGCDPDLAGC
jgi:tetratricopeptide (TPR) repeat protein